VLAQRIAFGVPPARCGDVPPVRQRTHGACARAQTSTCFRRATDSSGACDSAVVRGKLSDSGGPLHPRRGAADRTARRYGVLDCDAVRTRFVAMKSGNFLQLRATLASNARYDTSSWWRASGLTTSMPVCMECEKRVRFQREARTVNVDRRL